MLVIAHRGARNRATENSIAAFEAAIADGVTAIEFDVQLTVDRVPVVCHDDHLIRLTGVDARISRLTLDELREVRVRAPGFEPQPVPTLAQVLHVLDGRVDIYAELKAMLDPDDGFRSSRVVAEAAVPLLRDARNVIVSSFDPAGPAYARTVAGMRIAHGVVHASACTPWASSARAAGCIQVHLEDTLVDTEAIEAATALGLEVCAWTVNDLATARRFERLGVSAIFSDEPGPMIRALTASDADA